MTNRKFNHSFRRVVTDLEPGQECGLKRHYLGALREVVGILDLWAANDQERFVFAFVDAILEHCHRYKQPKDKFTKRWIEQALKELRTRHIVSKRLTRVRDDVEVFGFIVAPHDCLAVRPSPTKCVLTGYLQAAGRWERSVEKVLDSTGAWTGEWKVGHIFWAGYSSSENGSGSGSGNSSVHSSENSSVHNSDAHSAQPSKTEKVNCENRALTALTASVVGAERAEAALQTGFNPPAPGSQVKTESPNANSNPNGKSNSNPGAVSLSAQPTKSKTPTKTTPMMHDQNR